MTKHRQLDKSTHLRDHDTDPSYWRLSSLRTVLDFPMYVLITIMGIIERLQV